jgi:hypothetical protein
MNNEELIHLLLILHQMNNNCIIVNKNPYKHCSNVAIRRELTFEIVGKGTSDV